MRLTMFRSATALQAAAAHGQTGGGRDLGALPEWRLEDLYPGIDAPEFGADMRRAIGLAKQFSQDYRGKLEGLIGKADGADALTGAVRQYEALQDLVGRLMSFASLTYAGDNSDAALRGTDAYFVSPRA